ncbi:thymidylate kinase [Patescibacteria group bacterium]|nr:thymidylate kinase [Patescibacteria group bacterium]
MKMKGRKGQFIVFEGIDGAGKTTQTNLLIKHLKRIGKKVASIHFPQYQTKSGGLIENYLLGHYGKVGPYQASVFYAADRFDGGLHIKQWLRGGYIVVVDRYLASNIGHQGGKIRDIKEREKFFRWLYYFEYGLFQIPKPIISFLLKMPPRVAQRLTKKHGKKLDVHEKDIRHLQHADRAYQHATKVFPRDFQIINSMSGSALRSPRDIHNEVWNKVQELL